MSDEVRFWVYLGAIACFLIAALGETWRYGMRTRRGLKPLIAAMPLGLAVALLPTLWDVAERAF
jgi:hypothetical protein